MKLQKKAAKIREILKIRIAFNSEKYENEPDLQR